MILKFSFNKGSEDQPKALAVVKSGSNVPAFSKNVQLHFSYSTNKTANKSPLYPFSSLCLSSVHFHLRFSFNNFKVCIKASLLLFRFLQLTAVVVSLVAVHDTQYILQDGWAQVQI